MRDRLIQDRWSPAIRDAIEANYIYSGDIAFNRIYEPFPARVE